MKKFLLTLGVVAAASASYAQGLVTFDTLAGTQLTNTTVSTFAAGFTPQGNGATVAGVNGKTGTAANGFYYTLLIAASSQGANPGAAGWTQALYTPTTGPAVSAGIIGTNIAAIGGDAQGPKGTSSTIIDNWGGAATMSFMIVGWSANLGTDWATVKGELAANWAGLSAANQYYFGTSAIASGASGVPPTGTPLNVWSATGTFSLFQVGAVAAVPEPATMVLAGLGGLSLLALRRKK